MPSNPSKSLVHVLPQAAVLEISCPNCGRHYRIRRNRIPAKASAVVCKDCGKKIRLRKSSSGTSVRRSHWTGPRFRLDLMTPEKRSSRGRFKRKIA